MLLLAAILWVGGERRRAQSGLPAGDVVYNDTGAWRANNHVLHAADLRLAGKPDYLVEQADGSVIPVEVEVRPGPSQAVGRAGLAVGCLLPVGRGELRRAAALRYFAVPETGRLPLSTRAELENDLLDLLDEMRATAVDDDVLPEPRSASRCARCGVRDACDYRLD